MAIGFAFGSAVISRQLTMAVDPSMGVPKAYLYTDGYLITLGFALLVLVVTGVSRLLHRGESLGFAQEA